MKRLPYILLMFSMLSCSDILMHDFGDAELKQQDFETTWFIVDRVYPYFQFKGIDWVDLRTVYQTKIDTVDDNEYLGVIFDLLCELDDGHVGLRLANGEYLHKITPRGLKDQGSFDQAVTVQYLDSDLTLVGKEYIGFATVNNDIGYVRITTLDDWESHWIYEFDNVLNRFSNTKGLIIDVRDNGGGSTNNGEYITSHFLHHDLQTPGSYTKDGYMTGSIISPKTPYYNNRVVVLTNGCCFSSTEHFVMNIQQIEHVTVVGDTTGGGSGNPIYYDLPSGALIRVSRQNFLQYNQTPIEWNGIVPDILVPQTKKDVEIRRDKQLEAAIKYLES